MEAHKRPQTGGKHIENKNITTESGEAFQIKSYTELLHKGNVIQMDTHGTASRMKILRSVPLEQLRNKVAI